MARSIGSIHISDNSVTSINDAIQQLMFLMDELRGEHDSTTIKIGPHTHAGITGPAGQDGGVINIPAQSIDHDDLTNVTSDQHHTKLHSATHGPGGVDALKLDNLDTPDDNTDLDSQISQHGLLRKLDNDANHFLDGQGNWSSVVATPDESTDVENVEAQLSTPLWEELLGDENADSIPGGWRYVWKKSAQTSNNNTIGNALDLVFKADANTTYIVEGVLYATNPSTTGDMKFDLLAPTGSTGGQSTWTIGTASTASGSTVILGTRSVVDGSNPFTIGLYNDFISSTINAIIAVSSTAGEIQLRFSENATDAVNVTTLKAGSYLRYRTLP